jgi:hypothetical protein
VCAEEQGGINEICSTSPTCLSHPKKKKTERIHQVGKKQRRVGGWAAQQTTMRVLSPDFEMGTSARTAAERLFDSSADRQTSAMATALTAEHNSWLIFDLKRCFTSHNFTLYSSVTRSSCTRENLFVYIICAIGKYTHAVSF